MMIQRNNVHAWALMDDKLIYTDEANRQFCIEILKTGVTQKYNVNYAPTFFYQIPENRLVVVDDLYQPSSIYAGSNLQPVDMHAIGGILVQDQDPRYQVFFKREDDDTRYKVFDWLENRVIVESERPFTIIKDKAFTIIDGVLNCYTLKGTLSWQYKPAAADPQLDFGDPTKMIGLYKNELWMQPNKNSFIVLDAVTGKPIHPNFHVKEKLGLTEFSLGDTYLDEPGGRIRILANSYYVEINLATHTADIRKKHEGEWRIGNGRFYEGDVRAYFIGNNSDTRQSIGKITAGIFNTETLAIEWHFSLPDETRNHFFVGQPQANEKYFGVKDNKDVVYLFER